MDFKLRNFGKISEADIKLDGITVICGDNNTGKSTVGKALFSFYYSLTDLNNRIYSMKINRIREYLFSYAFSATKRNGYSFRDGDDFEELRSKDKISTDELKNYIDNHIIFGEGVKVTKESLIPLVDDLNVPITKIINELVLRDFDNVMNGQVQNCYNTSQKCTVEATFNVKTTESGDESKKSNIISFNEATCECNQLDVSVQHKAYYINSPFVLDWLNNPDRINILRTMNPMDRSTVLAIVKAQTDINVDSMSNILESVGNKADVEEVKKILKSAYRGDTKISNGKYFYTDENGKDFDFRNISAGLKSFALIERMLETGVLKKKDILIFDEPEIHLHSEWQIIYAELIVLLQKKFELTVLIVTHSFHFLESLNFFMKKYDTLSKGNFYIPQKNNNEIIIKSYGNDALELKKVLSTGSVTLSDLKFKYEMENYREEDN